MSRMPFRVFTSMIVKLGAKLIGSDGISFDQRHGSAVELANKIVKPSNLDKESVVWL